MIITVQVKTGAKLTQILSQPSATSFIVALRASPVDNQANLELIELIAKHFKISKSRIAIKRGLKAKLKTLELI